MSHSMLGGWLAIVIACAGVAGCQRETQTDRSPARAEAAPEAAAPVPVAAEPAVQEPEIAAPAPAPAAAQAEAPAEVQAQTEPKAQLKHVRKSAALPKLASAQRPVAHAASDTQAVSAEPLVTDFGGRR